VQHVEAGEARPHHHHVHRLRHGAAPCCLSHASPAGANRTFRRPAGHSQAGRSTPPAAHRGSQVTRARAVYTPPHFV
jgi:hypothetical protein